MRSIAVVALVVSVVLLTFAATQQPVKINVPVLPTERDEFGGRPGTFHFVTNEQTMAEAADLQKAVSAVAAIEEKMAALTPSERERFAPELNTLKTFVAQVDSSRNSSAGKTAAEIEQRLNASKGKFMCGACHGQGMGMMHRGGMGPGGDDNR